MEKNYEDVLLQKFFQKERWQKAIQIGVDKGINKSELKYLCSSSTRLTLYDMIRNNKYEIMPPHQIKIPKEDGSFRIVYSNEGIDRVVLNILNDLLFEEMPDLIHSSCKSYQHGIGTGRILKDLSSKLPADNGHFIIGFKADLEKYFDSIKIEYIDAIFDKIEARCGKSVLISILRKYYHSNLCFNTKGYLIKQYQSLKQGCAVSSFLANSILFSLDEVMSKQSGYYVRYSDDILYIGGDYNKTKKVLEKCINSFGLKLNQDKFEMIYSDRWFKFLGFYLKGNKITFAKSKVKKFQKEIERVTIKKKKKLTEKQVIRAVMRSLYGGKGNYSWATYVLPVVNVQKDLDQLNLFAMDCIRACVTNKKEIGGLGSIQDRDDYTVVRGVGKNVKSNREKTEKNLNGYVSLRCAQNALLTSREAYDTLIRPMIH